MNGNQGRECESSIDAEISITTYNWYLKHWSVLHNHYQKGVYSLEFDVKNSGGCKCKLLFEPGVPQTSTKAGHIHERYTTQQVPAGQAAVPSYNGCAFVEVIFLKNIQYHTMQIEVSVVDKYMTPLTKIRKVYESIGTDETYRRTLCFDTVLRAPEINKYLQNDTLILMFEMKIATTIVQIPINIESFAPNISDCIREEIIDLYKAKDLCDVTFTFKDTSKTCCGHKLILAASSEVLKARFTTEKKEDFVSIEDIDHPLFETFLSYVYTGKVEKIGDIVHELIIVADKYKVESLKKICEQYMKAHLSDANALKYLLRAHQLSCQTLTTQAIEYIKDHLHILSDADEYILLSKYPKLIVRIFGNSNNNDAEKDTSEKGEPFSDDDDDYDYE